MNNNYEIFNKVWKNYEKNENGYINVSGGCRWLNARIGDMIKRNGLPDRVKSIIDIGSGDGSRIYHAMHYFPEATLKGYDFTENAVVLANKRYGSDRIQFYCADVMQNDVECRADMITAFGILEHIEDWKSLVKKWGGMSSKYILIYTNTGKMHKNEKYVGHVRNFKKGELEQYFDELGWRTVDASYGGFPLYDLVLKKIQYHNADKYLERIAREPDKLERIAHNILFFMLRFCCLQNKGGAELIALFCNPEYDKENNTGKG